MTADNDGEGITLLGSEMLTWSDADGSTGAFGGLLAPHLLHLSAGSRGRALVAGPTTAAVIRDIAAGYAQTDVLVRSFLDARALRAALPDSIGVFCGPLDRMARRVAGGGSTYDAVVAVAGTDRLHTAEEDTPLPATTLADLATLVADGGDLLVGVGNPVGVDRLLSLGSASSHQDADWPDGLASAVALPLSVDATASVLAGHGLDPVETWHCHGRRSDPLVAAPSSTFGARAEDSVLVREVGRAYDVLDPSAPAIKDPAATVRDLVRAGLGASTAPLTVLHLRRGGAAVDPADTVLVCEPAHDGAPALAYRLVPGGAGWSRELLGEPTTIQVAPGLSRTTGALVGPVPSGPTLAESVEALCAVHDVTAAGALVRRYRDWLGTGTIAPDRVPVTPGLLAVDGDALALIDPSWIAAAPAPRDVVLARGLLDVAADLLARGVRHPWSAAASARTIAASLLAAAAIEDSAPVLAAAVELDAELRPAGTVPDYDVPGNAGRRSYAELAELAEAAAIRAADGDGHVLWLLGRLQARQRMLRATRSKVRSLETSREMWIGRRVLVLRSLRRRRQERREALLDGPTGEWRDPSTIPPDPFEDPEGVVRVEEDLLPPGYEPPEQVEVLPREDV
ncbi:MAG: hypothetical protein ACJ72D_29270 [Marmoricola sp.]